jgi:hypothetical protein
MALIDEWMYVQRRLWLQSYTMMVVRDGMDELIGKYPCYSTKQRQGEQHKTSTESNDETIANHIQIG